MRRAKRWIAFILCFAMTVSMLTALQKETIVQGSQDITKFDIPVISNEYEESKVDVYEAEGRYYFTVEDIAAFTRFTLEESASALTLKQGVRTVVIEKKTGHMYDFGATDQGNISLLEQDGSYLCEAVPILTYLGASCSIGEGNVLEIFMPMYTLWEAIMPNYEVLLIDMEEAYGSVTEMKGSLICAMISDILDVRNGHGIFANGDTYLNDALHEILKMDVMQYSVVQEEMVAQNQKANDFFASERVQNYLKQQEDWNETARDFFEQYMSLCTADEAEEFLKGFRQLYDKIITDFDIKNEKAFETGLKVGSMVYDIMKTSQEIMNYDETAKTLFARTINEEVIAYAGYDDIIWKENAKKISKEVESNQSIVASATMDKLIEEVLDEIQGNGLEYVISKFVAKGGSLYAATVEVALYIASFLNSDAHETFYSERSAVYLNVMQYDTLKLLDGLLLNCKEKGQFSDEKVLANIKSVLELYYRTSLAFSDHMAKSVEKFGSGNKVEASRYFKENVGNAAALFLHFVTNCTVVPIRDYAELAESCRTGAIVEAMSRKVEEKKQQLQELESYVAKAERYIKVGNYDGARKILDEAYRASGINELLEKKAEVYLTESDVYLKDREYNKAIEVLIEGQEDTGVAMLYEREAYLREHLVLEKVIIYYNGKKDSVEEYEDGVLDLITYYDGRDLEYEKYYYGYDDENRCVGKLISSRDGKDFYKLSEERVYQYKYDNEGRCIEEIYEVDDRIFSWREYIYDNSGNCIKELSYDSNGEFIGTHEYEYTNGNRTKSTSYDVDGKVESWNEYKYDEKGNCIEEFVYDIDGKLKYRFEYKYDMKGNRIEEFFYNQAGEIIYWEESEYDSFGNTIRTVSRYVGISYREYVYFYYYDGR